MKAIKPEPVYCIDPKKQKKVLAGYYDHFEKTFYKKVSHKHFMRVEQGYGIQKDVMRQLQEVGCQRIFVTSDTIRSVSFEDWDSQPVRNYGNGSQKFYRWDLMKKEPMEVCDGV